MEGGQTDRAIQIWTTGDDDIARDTTKAAMQRIKTELALELGLKHTLDSAQHPTVARLLKRLPSNHPQRFEPALIACNRRTLPG